MLTFITSRPLSSLRHKYQLRATYKVDTPNSLAAGGIQTSTLHAYQLKEEKSPYSLNLKGALSFHANCMVLCMIYKRLPKMKGIKKRTTSLHFWNKINLLLILEKVDDWLLHIVNLFHSLTFTDFIIINIYPTTSLCLIYCNFILLISLLPNPLGWCQTFHKLKNLK